MSKNFIFVLLFLFVVVAFSYSQPLVQRVELFDRVFFNPSTIFVKQGNVLELDFRFSRPVDFMIDDFLVSTARTNSIAVFAMNKGVYSYYCLNCGIKKTGNIVVY